jgi:hypothetical protein
MDNYSKNGNEIKGLQFQQWCQEKGIAIPTKVPRKRDCNPNKGAKKKGLQSQQRCQEKGIAILTAANMKTG